VCISATYSSSPYVCVYFFDLSFIRAWERRWQAFALATLFFFVLFIIGRISAWFRLIYTCGSGFLDDVVCVLVWLVQPGGHGDGRGECWGSFRHVVTKRGTSYKYKDNEKGISKREREKTRLQATTTILLYTSTPPPPHTHTHTHAAVWSI
jgi:hypothetical protein